jgi:hypothetical protein
MKPIINEGDYVISLFDDKDDEVKQIHITQGMMFAIEQAKELLRNYPVGYSYRVMRCLKNSKYNIHSPSTKQKG